MIEDFPNNEVEFDRRFHSEDAYFGYLLQLRWPEALNVPVVTMINTNKFQRPLSLSSLRVSAFGDRWNDFTRDQKTFDSLVQGPPVVFDPKNGVNDTAL